MKLELFIKQTPLYNQDMIHPDKLFMNCAIKFARQNFKPGGHAVGAVIVRKNEIIAKGYTTTEEEQDPTCHAEINAIREAAHVLKSKRLEDCYLYTTYEPCPMCTSAAIWARMKGIIYGASRFDANEHYTWRVDISASEIINSGTPKLEVYAEFMRKECSDLLGLK